MTTDTIGRVLQQAKDTGTVEWIYFEGGEPFLYYQTMLAGVDRASDLGFNIGIVTNSYWATSEEDARLWLDPLAGKVQDLTISSDLFHFNEKFSQESIYVKLAAHELGIPVGVICIEEPDVTSISTMGMIPPESSSIMFRGRASEKLASKVPQYSAGMFTKCPHENLRDPGRIHVDPFGNLHICQGISIGNIFTKSIESISREFDPYAHPITGPLLNGGPNMLALQNEIDASSTYADACHLCYETRKMLRCKYPDVLTPDQMYNSKA